VAAPNIFGALYAKTYDAIYGNKNYAHECDILEQLFETKSSVISILDLGCGTGGHAAELSKRDYRITGLDQSAEMIKIAQSKNLPSCKFRQEDICSYHLDQKFDAVILMFNVIGYIPDEDRLKALLSTARQHLIPDGMLIFDFWYAPAVRKNPPGQSAREAGLAGQTVYREASGTLDSDQNCVLVDCAISCGTASASVFHKVMYFELDELQLLLRQSNFYNVKFGNMPNFTTPPTPANWPALSWSKAG
jgi:SAM-dependent methyltransferase